MVHLGCKNGELVTALGIKENILIQGLDKDESNVTLAQKNISDKSLNAWITVRSINGDKMPDQIGDVLLAHPERRYGDRKNAEAVK